MLALLWELTVAWKSPPWVDFTLRTYKQLRGWSHFSKRGDRTKPILYKNGWGKHSALGASTRTDHWDPHILLSLTRELAVPFVWVSSVLQSLTPIPLEATHPLPVTHNSCLLFHLLNLDFFLFRGLSLPSESVVSIFEIEKCVICKGVLTLILMIGNFVFLCRDSLGIRKWVCPLYVF